MTNFALVIDFIDAEPKALVALRTLRTLSTTQHYAQQYRVRHPLGIYNTSLSRVTYRAKRFCELLHEHFKTRRTIAHEQLVPDQLLEDYLELFIYSLAEHVDDCEIILKTLFQDEKQFGSNKPVRKFKEAIKPFRRDFSHLANAIKHNHQRLRLFATESIFKTETLLLLGFFIERCVDEVVGPDPNFFPAEKQVLSVVSFVWSCLINVARISSQLDQTLRTLCPEGGPILHPAADLEFRQLFQLLGALPMYQFDDENPFRCVDLQLDGKPDSATTIFVASFFKATAKSDFAGFGRTTASFRGDGVSKSFKIPTPGGITFHF